MIGVDSNTRETIGPPHSAIRLGPGKLLYFYEDLHLDLYDLPADQSEGTDLAATCEKLNADSQGYLKSVNACLRVKTNRPKFRVTAADCDVLLPRRVPRGRS